MPSEVWRGCQEDSACLLKRWAEQYQKPIKAAILGQLQTVREGAERYGGRLVNISQRSRVDVLERMVPDEWLHVA